MQIVGEFADFRKDQNLFVSAGFDLENLKNQVASIILSRHLEPAVRGKAESQSLILLALRILKPQYTRLQQILGGCDRPEDLERLKRAVVSIAESSHEVVKIYPENGQMDTAQVRSSILSSISETWRERAARFRSMMAECSCIDDERLQHCGLLEDLPKKQKPTSETQKVRPLV